MRCAKKKKHSGKFKVAVCLGVLFSIFLSVFLYFHFIVGPKVAEVSRAQVDSIATTVVSDGIYNVMLDKGYKYEDFVDTKYSQTNEIVSISANSIVLNKFARELSTETQIQLDTIIDHSIAIPLGSFTGINALSAIGPKINVQIMPIGSVLTSFASKFDSVGINQVRHSIYIDVNITIAVVLPLGSQNIDFVTQVLICENIIVGKVPDVYLNGLAKI